MDNNFYWDLVNKALQTLLAALLPVLLGLVIQAVKAYADKLKAQVGTAHYAQAEEIVRAVVLAAEQTGLAAEIKLQAAEKRAYALAAAERTLAARGIHIDLDALEAMIEAQVYEEFNRYKPLALGQEA